MSSSLALRRHLSAYPFKSCPSSCVLCRPQATFKRHLTGYIGPLACASSKARFRISQPVRKPLPWPSEVPLTGFGYPLSGFRTHCPRKPLSALNTYGLIPSKLCSSPAIEKKFPFLFRSRTSLQNVSTLHRCLSDFPLPNQPCPFLPPDCLCRVGTCCSLGCHGLSGFLLSRPRCRRLSVIALFHPYLCITFR